MSLSFILNIYKIEEIKIIFNASESCVEGVSRGGSPTHDPQSHGRDGNPSTFSPSCGRIVGMGSTSNFLQQRIRIIVHHFGCN